MAMTLVNPNGLTLTKYSVRVQRVNYAVSVKLQIH